MIFWLSAHPWPDDGILRLFGHEKSPCLGRSRAAVPSRRSTLRNTAARMACSFLKAGCVVAVIGALDALITLDALLYALLYLFGLAFAFYPLVKWCRENEGFSWPWPHVQSEKKRIKELRKEQKTHALQDEDKK